MLIIFSLLVTSLIGSSIGSDNHCDVTCTAGVYPVVKEGQCICSPGFPGSYNKGDICTVRLSVNKEKRIKLQATHFNLRYGPDCNQDRLKFRNMHNKNNMAHYMRKVCRRHQMIQDKYIIVNTHQSRMDFRAPKDGKSTENHFWRVCLMAPYSPNNFKVDCPLTMENMEIGFNRRQTYISSNSSLVNEICCVSTGFTKKDDAHMMCEPEHIPKAHIKNNGEPTCLTCSSAHPRVSVEADISGSTAHKKIHCTCATEEGVPIGGNCTGDRPCLDLRDLAFCNVDNTCTCPQGKVPDPTNSYCGPVAKLGDDCSNGEVCISEKGHSICNGTVCICPPLFDSDIENNVCEQRALIGESCAGGKTCMDTNNKAYCDVDGDNTCKCPSGNVPAQTNDACQPLVNLGEGCSAGQVCHSENGLSTCNGAVCDCPSGYQEDVQNNICRQLVALGEDCSDGQVCHSKNGVSTCNGETCGCPNGYQEDVPDNTCRKLVGVGDDCSGGQVCDSKNGVSTCNGATCDCPSGYQKDVPHNVCRKLVPIDDLCTDDSICVDSNNKAYCGWMDEEHVCMCPTNFAPDTQGESCVPAVAIGESCVNGEKCMDLYRRAYCDGSTCVCPATFEPNPSKTFCKKDVAIGEYCTHGIFCIDPLNRAICQGRKCTCPSGSTALPASTKQYCSLDSNYDETCEDDRDCTQKRSEKCNTRTKKCVCESPFVYHKSVCSYKSIYDKICDNDNDCYAKEGVCNGARKCRCPYHYDKSRDGTKCTPYCQQKPYKGKARKFYLNEIVCNRKTGNKCYACRCEKPPGDMRVVDTNTAVKRVCQKMKKCHGKTQTEIKNGNKCGE